ncbi:MAG: hypothetical protein GWN58_27750 [Anaerolineae bacterium]|nr:hypothetical protein [Anaerolineae bacterium]
MHPLHKIAQTTLLALADMGIAKVYKDGTVDTPRIARLLMTDDGTWGGIEFNTDYAPPGVRLHRIVDKNVVEEIQTRTKHRCGPLNTTGITLAFQMATPDHLPTFIELDLFSLPDKPYSIPIGEGRFGPIWRTLDQTSHILVGGESRGGKTTWLNCVIASLLSRHPPEELHLVLIDGKAVEFTYLTNIPHLHGWPIANTPEECTDAIEALAEEMDKRQAMFSAAFARNLTVYNARAEEAGLTKLPRLVAIVDEVTDIAVQAGKAFVEPLIRLASKGASFGITLILSTQNPRFDILPTTVKGNLSVRIAFRVATTDHSRTILGDTGAEALPRTIRGRLMARLDSRNVALQGYYLSEAALIRLADLVRGHPLDIAGRLANIGPRHRLTHLEREMILYAWDEMDGRFPVRDIYDHFHSRITRDEVITLGQKWERKGWLTHPSAGGDRARHVTPELAKLAEEMAN